MIIDGTGDGFRAKVGSDNRLAVDAITESIEEKAITEGDGYNVSTDRVTLTSTNESALFYLENKEDQDLIINSTFVNTSNSVGTLSGAQPTLKIYRNPTEGTIIDTAKSISPINSNFGSAKVLLANIYEGSEGDTFTKDQGIIEVPLATREALPLVEFSTTVILPRGASYGISYQPETGSTSVDMIVGVTVIKLPEEFA
jgi:hypothetical protein